jgi:hypothetical protein
MIDAFSLSNSIESADASDLLAKASGFFFETDIVQQALLVTIEI